MIQHLKVQLESIKFTHSIFALPFALIATLLARQGELPTLVEWICILLAMVGARTWAMSVNRAADAHFDSMNPRTQNRPLPTGKLTKKSVWLFAFTGAFVFLAAAAMMSPMALYCAPLILLILASYSYTKRFTILCHFWLGFCLGLAPLGAWVALNNVFPWELIPLTIAITFWVAGFDIIYAVQDQEFDRENNLYSIPARFGTQNAMWIARSSHFISALCFAYFGARFDLGFTYFIGLALVTLLMIWQHVAVNDPAKINFAFFNLNGWIAVTLLGATCASLYLHKN